MPDDQAWGVASFEGAREPTGSGRPELGSVVLSTVVSERFGFGMINSTNLSKHSKYIFFFAA